MRALLLGFLALFTLAAFAVWPQIDLIVSGWFYHSDGGFFLADTPVLEAVHVIAYRGARILGLVFILLAVVAASRRRPVLRLDAKAWAFLLLGLLIGPGLVANGALKDHWGRARPREITEFDGWAQFTPALVPSDQCKRNCSFVSGDGAFGFYLTAFAFVIPLPRSRRYFWAGMGAGAVFAFARIAAGAHFLSDNVYAAILMLAVLTALHAIMYGRAKMRRYWRFWLFFSE
jgi:lipid A 4'-phosphatase